MLKGHTKFSPDGGFGMIRKQYRRANVYTIGQVADEIISSIVRTKQEWKSPRYLSLPFKIVVEKEGIAL